MTGNKLRSALQRTAGWCEAACKTEDNSSSSFRSKASRLVESDGNSRYRVTVYGHGIRWAQSAKQSGTAEYTSSLLCNGFSVA